MNSDRYSEDYATRDLERTELHGATWHTPPRRGRGLLLLVLAVAILAGAIWQIH